MSLTEIARQHDKDSPGYVVQSWLRSRNTLAFLRLWEREHNPFFREDEYAMLTEEVKKGSLTLTPKQWIARTNAIGMPTRQGKNGGTQAQPDIAVDFHMWVNPTVRLELIQGFRRG